MPKITAEVECPVHRSFRVEQVAGMFDVAIGDRAQQSFAVEIPGLDEPWQIGLIMGPSGSGKSTIARHAFGEAAMYRGGPSTWPTDCAVVDAFDSSMSMRDVASILSSVGFSSPPSWIKPWHVLSNGEQFRCDLARALLSDHKLIVFDEFTSVVDRTVACIGSAAVSKALQRMPTRRLVAVSCHSDIREWLQPDWVVDMATCQLARGKLQRPPIRLEIRRVPSSMWSAFKRHHYLTASVAPSATCFAAFIDREPVAFDAWLPFFGRLKNQTKARRGHRTVCLPDFQGVGIGAALFNHNASLWAGLGYRAFSCTAHPAEIASRMRSGLWSLTSPPSFHAKDSNRVDMHRSRATDRKPASFEFIGPPMDRERAKGLLQRWD